MSKNIARLGAFLSLSLFLFIILQACSLNAEKNKNKSSEKQIGIIPQHKFYLPHALEETSGLIYMKGKCYSHNDSQGGNLLFRFDTINGDIDQRIYITNAKNIDWEDVAMDENYIYVGDFGNNRGNRKDLKIYRIDKALIPENGDVKLEAELIHFSYAEQDDFTHRHKHNFDCEAMLAHNDKIYLFSKNRGNEHTKIYVLPNEPGTYVVEKTDEFDVNCLITGADLSPGGELALIGYTNKSWNPVLCLFYDFKDDHFFKGKFKRFKFPSLADSQTEAIVYYDDDKVFISGEQTKTSTQRVFQLNTTELKNAKH